MFEDEIGQNPLNGVHSCMEHKAVHYLHFRFFRVDSRLDILELMKIELWHQRCGVGEEWRGTRHLDTLHVKGAHL